MSFQAYIAPINDVDAASISFGGEQIDLVPQLALEAKVITTDIRGVLDRVTGHLLATTTLYPTKQPYDPTPSLSRTSMTWIARPGRSKQIIGTKQQDRRDRRAIAFRRVRGPVLRVAP